MGEGEAECLHSVIPGSETQRGSSLVLLLLLGVAQCPPYTHLHVKGKRFRESYVFPVDVARRFICNNYLMNN